MQIYYRRLIISLISLLSIVSLSGCSSVLSSRMPNEGIGMSQAYHDAISGSDSSPNDSVVQANMPVRSFALQTTDYTKYTRTQANEINNLFPRVHNPNVVMYVYPHLTGKGANKVPVPGYSTVFSLYKQVHYKMPD